MSAVSVVRRVAPMPVIVALQEEEEKLYTILQIVKRRVAGHPTF